jgi:von Willebrand factor type A domain
VNAHPTKLQASGFTISAGINPAGNDLSTLLGYGISEDILYKIYDFFGQKDDYLDSAEQYKKFYGTFPELTYDEAITMFTKVLDGKIILLASTYDNYPSRGPLRLNELPIGIRSAIYSVCHSNNEDVTKFRKFWSYATGQKWSMAMKELWDFEDDSPAARNREAIIIENALAPGCSSTSKKDIVFVFDSSGSIEDSDYQPMKDFSSYLVNAWNVSEDGIKVGMVIYSNYAAILSNITGDKQSLLEIIKMHFKYSSLLILKRD